MNQTIQGLKSASVKQEKNLIVGDIETGSVINLGFNPHHWLFFLVKTSKIEEKKRHKLSLVLFGEFHT